MAMLSKYQEISHLTIGQRSPIKWMVGGPSFHQGCLMVVHLQIYVCTQGICVDILGKNNAGNRKLSSQLQLFIYTCLLICIPTLCLMCVRFFACLFVCLLVWTLYIPRVCPLVLGHLDDHSAINPFSSPTGESSWAGITPMLAPLASSTIIYSLITYNYFIAVLVIVILVTHDDTQPVNHYSDQPFMNHINGY